jgi:hypothetical protein
MQGKDLFMSKTTWGIILTLLSPLFGKIGLSPDLDALASTLAELVGIGIALWGQLTRKTEITSIAGVAVKDAPKLILPLLVLGALMATGVACSPMVRIVPEPLTTASPTEKAITDAQEIVAQSTKAVIRAQRAIDKETGAGVLTKAELKAASKKVDSALSLLEEANSYLKDGNIAKALSQADGVDALASVAENELAKRLAERRKSQ